MSPIERECIEALEQRIRDLERGRGRRFRSTLILGGLVLVAGLSASVPRLGDTAIESRLIALESLIRQGPSGTSQMRMPLQVTDASGKVVFNVGNTPVAGAVNIVRTPQYPAPVFMVSSGSGKPVVTIGVNQEGSGRISAMDKEGRLAGALSEVGAVVFNAEGVQVAGITRGDGAGRVAVWHDNQLAVELTATPKGDGRVRSFNAAGKLRAALYGELGVGVFDDKENNVAVMLNKDGGGVIGVSTTSATKLSVAMAADSNGGGRVAVNASDGSRAVTLLGNARVISVSNQQGKSVAEMLLGPTGAGLFQVWSDGKLPLALLGKAAERPGGIMQLSNGNSVTTSFTVNSGGDGYWQLNDAGGTPIVEAGMTTGGKGTVKAGPRALCQPQQTSIVNRLPDCILGRSQ